MQEINEYIVNRIRTDVSIISLMGITVGDYRIYYWNPNIDIIYNSTTPAAILYRTAGKKRPSKWSYPEQKMPLFVYFRVLSYLQATANSVADRIENLFDQLNFQTTSYNVKGAEVISRVDGDCEGTPEKPIWVVHTSFDFKNVFYRGS